jgi:hypothetical protein
VGYSLGLPVHEKVVHRFAEFQGEMLELTARNPDVDYKPIYAYHLEVRLPVEQQWRDIVAKVEKMLKACDELTTLQQQMKQSTEQWKDVVKKALVSEMTKFEAQIKSAYASASPQEKERLRAEAEKTKALHMLAEGPPKHAVEPPSADDIAKNGLRPQVTSVDSAADDFVYM